MLKRLDRAKPYKVNIYYCLLLNYMFKKIEASQTNGDNLPFFNVWQKALDSEQIKEEVGKIECSVSVKEAMSGKGFFLKFTRFTVFVWKNSTHGKYLESLFELPFSECFAICIKATRKGLDYDLGTMDDVIMFHKLNKPEEDTIEFISQEEQTAMEEEQKRNKALKTAMDKANKEITKKTMESLKPKNTP